MLRTILAMLLALASGATMAQTYNTPPHDGYWWNPLESGRGWTLESQNETVVITHYAYDQSGRSTFFQNASQWNSATRSLTTTLLGLSGGQCVGCAYVSPVVSNIGTITFTFTNNTRGRVTYPNGVSIPIERFQFTYSDPRAYLKGVWASLWISGSGQEFVNPIYLSTNCTTCSTPNTVNGRLLFTSSSGRLVVGAPTSSTSGIFLVLVDATPSYYDYYYVLPESNSWTGLACTRLKSDPAPSLSSCDGIMFASRSSTQAEAAVLFGPTAVSNQKVVSHDRETARRSALKGARASEESQAVGKRIASIEADATSLRAAMEKLRLQVNDETANHQSN